MIIEVEKEKTVLLDLVEVEKINKEGSELEFYRACQEVLLNKSKAVVTFPHDNWAYVFIHIYAENETELIEYAFPQYRKAKNRLRRMS